MQVQGVGRSGNRACEQTVRGESLCVDFEHRRGLVWQSISLEASRMSTVANGFLETTDKVHGWQVGIGEELTAERLTAWIGERLAAAEAAIAALVAFDGPRTP